VSAFFNGRDGVKGWKIYGAIEKSFRYFFLIFGKKLKLEKYIKKLNKKF
jgi:hypothetical protein